MENPRAEKVAVVEEVKARLGESSGTILTEYRGLKVSELAELRKSLEKAGGTYKIYKNTLVRLATAGSEHDPLHALLEGPTAIAFVDGEISAVAKALRDYARTNPNLVVKGGMFGQQVLSGTELGVLADLPPRDVLLARLAGGIAAPLQQLAGLLQALPRNLAYGLSALIDTLPADPSAPTAPDSGAEAPAQPAAEQPSAEESSAEAEAQAPPAETPAAEADAAPAEAEGQPAETGESADAPADTATETTEASVETSESETKEQADNG
ncbi:MAG: 50S ribosomal protein L10 [Acidimicrobiales bacterium]